MTIDAKKSAQTHTSYRQACGKSDAAIFVSPGHRNTLESPKGMLIENICNKHGIGYTNFAWYGWGESTSPDVPPAGEGYVREWFQQELDLFDHETLGPQVVIGYSMGGYLALALAAARPERIKAVIGLNAGFGSGLKARIDTLYGVNRICPKGDPSLGFDFVPEDDGSLRIAGKLDIKCPIYLYHAIDDDVVSLRNTEHVKAAASGTRVNITVANGGTHYIDRPEDHAWLEEMICKLAVPHGK